MVGVCTVLYDYVQMPPTRAGAAKHKSTTYWQEKGYWHRYASSSSTHSVLAEGLPGPHGRIPSACDGAAAVVHLVLKPSHSTATIR